MLSDQQGEAQVVHSERCIEELVCVGHEHAKILERIVDQSSVIIRCAVMSIAPCESAGSAPSS